MSTTGDNPADFTTMIYNSDADPVIINNIVYKEKIIDLPVSGDIYIAFRVPPHASTGSYRGQMLMIDNVNIEAIPACPEAFNVVVNPNNITDSQMVVQWETAGTQSAWEVAVVPYNVDVTSGTIPSQYIHTATTNPFTVNGLTASSNYKVYVRNICSSTSQSIWSGPVEAITKCDAESACEYTLVLTSNGTASTGISVFQNSMKTHYVAFAGGNTPVSTPIFLCNGGEFELFFDTMGFAPAQYAQYQVSLLNSDGITVWASPMGVGPLKSVVYTGIAQCGPISCPQPTALTTAENGQFSWTAGGTETQWEVAVQPLDNQSLPQSGTIVNTPSYTPVAADFLDANVATYEYFVRAVCGAGETSYWSGPYDFVRNNGANNAMALPINNTLDCQNNVAKVSFRNATLSSEALACPGVKQSDVWFSFTAESKVHIIKAIGFEEYIYGTENVFVTLSNNLGFEKYPDFTMTLYRVNPDTSLTEISCVNNNALVTSYMSELVVGTSYKVRLTLNAPVVNTRLFNVCLTTPQDVCNLNAINHDFEEPMLPQYSGTWESNVSHTVIPGWRSNIATNDNIWIWEALNSVNVPSGAFLPYSQNQCIGFNYGDNPPAYNPADMVNIQGVFKDIDSSEITEFLYSFAHLGRLNSNMDLYAGPPSGPFTLVKAVNSTGSWNYVTGTYEVPAGQTTTRFIFRARNNSAGNTIDLANFIPNNKINATSENKNLDCANATYTASAEGVGTWIPAQDNPGPVVISDPSSRNITISGFMNPGTYAFTWKTRYCEDVLTLQYTGVDEIPVVTTPVDYCVGAVAAQLTAPDLTGYTAVWYDVPVGGTALATAPTPSTATDGTTSYYVAYVNAQGCEGQRALVNVEVNQIETPTVAFSYDAAEYCAIGANPVITPDPAITANGTFTVVPATGITLDATTGAIDLAGATAGVYDVTYTVAATGCNPEASQTVTITVNAATTPVADFTYANNVCLNATAALLPVPGAGFTTGGTYTSATVTVDPLTGEIDLATATAGTHDITYTIIEDTTLAGCMNAGSYTFQVALAEPTVPVTGFTYAAEYCIAGANPIPTTEANFYAGGTFSATGGLPIDPLTGEIDLATAQTGSYDVTYTVAEADCLEAGSTTVSVVVNALAAPVTTFSYPTPSCINSAATLEPTLDALFTTGGSFSSSTLTVDAATGAIDLTTATEGTHDIVYTITADATQCIDGGTFTATIELVAGVTPVTTFSYEESYCNGSANAFPDTATDFTAGGTFTSTTGLVINATTGEMNITDSTPGTYTIVYTIDADADTCNAGGSHSFTLTIVGGLEAEVSQECRDNNSWLFVTAVNGSFDAEAASYVWKDESGATVGTDAGLNLTAYAVANASEELPLTFTVTITSGDCSSEIVYEVYNIMCDVQRGISPNGDGMNDNLDLTGTGVKSVVIFNRYGKKVFEHGLGYTTQWHGQDNSGNELPDGTYFYSIENADGSNKTGWIYINK